MRGNDSSCGLCEHALMRDLNDIPCSVKPHGNLQPEGACRQTKAHTPLRVLYSRPFLSRGRHPSCSHVCMFGPLSLEGMLGVVIKGRRVSLFWSPIGPNLSALKTIKVRLHTFTNVHMLSTAYRSYICGCQAPPTTSIDRLHGIQQALR